MSVQVCVHDKLVRCVRINVTVETHSFISFSTAKQMTGVQVTRLKSKLLQ